MPGETILEVKDLRKHFPIRRGLFGRTVGHVKAVDGVSFDLARGETLGLVGESGCGKTTAGRTLLRLLDPVTGGSATFLGKDLFAMEGEELRKTRRHMQIIFQDPYASLNPRMTVGSIVGEPLAIHHIASGKAREERVAQLLHRVGLRPEHMRRDPHEFSGGQRQRIGIARALALNPDLIIADEPVSALDVSIQAQVINLLQDLQKEFGIAYVLVAHDLAVVQHISDRIAVMYLGKIVEMADADDLVMSPKHPYTEALLSAVPVPDPKVKKKRILLRGDVPSPVNPPSGCRFHTRCPYKEDICVKEEPPMREILSGHYAACHFSEKIFGIHTKSTPISVG